MIAIQRHYDRVAAELDATDTDTVLPSRNHAIVLVARLHRPTLRAIAYARATRPDVLEAVTVNVDDADTRRLVREWDQRKIPVSLKVVESPYREITKPVLDYVKRVRTKNPRDVVTVFVPEYVVGHWWEQVLHNQSALRIKTRLLFQPGVMVVSVPWQLKSSERVVERAELTPGAYRRGYPTAPRDDRPAPRRRPHRATARPADRPEGRRGRPGRRGTAAIMSSRAVADEPLMTAALHGGSEREGRASSASSTGRTACSTCDVGAVAHGGHCVARVRVDDGRERVVFVRHALPGERVHAVVTDDGGGAFCRADAIAVLEPAPGRVEPPCPWARAGGCGGCDWQHADAPTQRALKTAVLREQLQRLAGVESDVTVEPLPRQELPGGPAGLAAPGAARRRRRGPGRAARPPQPRRPADRRLPARPGRGAAAGARAAVRRRRRDRGGDRRRRGSGTCTRRARGCPARRSCSARSGGSGTCRPGTFWQVHPALAQTLADVVGQWAQAPAGGLAWDLYGGVGLFAAVLAEQVGPDGEVRVVESARQAVSDGRAALADLDQVHWTVGRVEHVLASLPGRPDVVVADPPRRGLGRATVAALCARTPGRVVHVACDPAALARDVALFAAHGYDLADLRAFDAFPMTHHMECVALFQRP